MSIFDELAEVTRELLDPEVLGAPEGSVTLTRVTTLPGEYGWSEPPTTSTTQVLRAQVFGVSSQLVGLPALEPANGVVLATDRQVISAVPEGGYLPGDLIAIDGKPVTIVWMSLIPAAGTPSAVKFVVR